MRDILEVSRWFYPGGVSILEWLAVLALAVFATVIACRLLTRTPRAIVAVFGVALCAIGAIVSVALTAAEVIVFRSSVPAAVAAYVVIGVSFGYLMSQLRAERSNGKKCATSAALVCGALAYLFVYGAIPPIVELAGDGLDAQGGNVLGNRPGTLAVTEFADFECPPCAVQDKIMDQLWTTYSDRITYSFRHFPKQRHAHAMPAAVASQCAAESGAFWETKRLLFSNQERLAEFLALPQLPTIPARETTRFAQCMQQRSAHWIVERDGRDAVGLGLTVTPSILIGNKLIQGIVRYPRLALIVERELRDRGTPAARQISVRTPAGCDALTALQACSQ